LVFPVVVFPAFPVIVTVFLLFDEEPVVSSPSGGKGGIVTVTLLSGI
jgi:hypothetical protein